MSEKGSTITRMSAAAVAGLALVAIAAAGCASGPTDRYSYDHARKPDHDSYNHAAVHRETYTANHPAMVVGGPAATAPQGAVEPWWFSRNDGRLNIREDGASRGHEATRVDIRDRQSVRPGRITDSYRRTVRSRRTEQFVR